MTKKELLAKVKFMEEAIKKGEDFELAAIPNYSYEGTFIDFEYYSSNTGLVEILINTDSQVYIILTAERLKRKKITLQQIEDSYCKCKLWDFENECKCSIPDKETLENQWYEELLQYVKSRVENIKKELL